MQDPNTSHLRKPWYQRALEMATIWRTLTSSTESPKKNTSSLWKILSNSKLRHIRKTNSKKVGPDKLKKCASLRLATSLTRVCLCAPMSSYTEVFRAEIPPRRNNTYPRSKSYSLHSDRISIPVPVPVPTVARLSTEGRRVFRGKSLTDDVLMRRFVVEEEAMIQVRRRNEMELIRKRSLSRRRKIGPSPLSRMVLAEEE